jgi:cell shape-determining protein MreD
VTRLAAVWAGASLTLIAAGALGDWLPTAWCPDVGLLVAVALGLHRSGASGLVLAWGVGWTEDLLSVAPFGEYALLRMLAWAATRAADRSIHLHQSGLRVGFVVFLTVVDAVVLLGLAHGFGVDGPIDPALFAVLLPRILVNALAVGFVSRAVHWGLGDLGERGTPRGLLRLEPRPPFL